MGPQTYFAVATDNDGLTSDAASAVGEVVVSVAVTGLNRSLPATLSGTTDSSNVFTSSWLSDLADGTHTALVIDISLDPFTWNQGLGQLSATHEIPRRAGASSTSTELTADSFAALDAVFSSGTERSSHSSRIVSETELDLLLGI